MGSPQTDQERIGQLEVRVKELEEWKDGSSFNTITDGFGSTWGPCPGCGQKMDIIRPGQVQCPKCG